MERCTYTWEEWDKQIGKFIKKQCSEKIWNSSGKYCIFHDPSQDKNIKLFQQELEKRLNKRNYNFWGFYFPKRWGFDIERFDKNVNFKEVTFQDTYFKDVFFQNADFRGATFQKDANFRGATFQNADFRGATFQKDANFRGATFQNADFREANFHNAYFRGATFHKNANFREATFHQKGTSFRRTTFHKNANFRGATFHKNATFRGATFHKNANFREATFHKNATFRGATFHKSTYFVEATFQNAFFRGVTFQNAYFERAVFQNAYFERATFHKNADFREATFCKDANFRGAVFQNAYFERVTFHNVYFNRVTFKRKLEFIPKKIEKFDLRNSEFLFRSKITAKLTKTIFYMAFMENLAFIDCTWPKNIVIYEEQHMRDEEIGLSFKELETIYRDLKRNIQRHGDYSKAGDFYYREMEMKRKGSKRGKRLWIELYRLLAGYGERPQYTATVSGSIILIFALLYWGFRCLQYSTRDPTLFQQIKDAVYFSFVTFTTLGLGDIHPVNDWGKALICCEAVIGAFLIALFVVVFVRKMAR